MDHIGEFTQVIAELVDVDGALGGHPLAPLDQLGVEFGDQGLAPGRIWLRHRPAGSRLLAQLLQFGGQRLPLTVHLQ